MFGRELLTGAVDAQAATRRNSWPPFSHPRLSAPSTLAAPSVVIVPLLKEKQLSLLSLCSLHSNTIMID
eukprot:5109483-Heterocapsa_arctica.AAC.1